MSEQYSFSVSLFIHSICFHFFRCARKTFWNSSRAYTSRSPRHVCLYILYSSYLFLHLSCLF